MVLLSNVRFICPYNNMKSFLVILKLCWQGLIYWLYIKKILYLPNHLNMFLSFEFNKKICCNQIFELLLLFLLDNVVLPNSNMFLIFVSWQCTPVDLFICCFHVSDGYF